MPPRDITFTLIGFAILLGTVLLTTRFPGSRVFKELSYSLSFSEERALEDLDTLSIALGRYHTTTDTYPTTAQGLDALLNRPAAAPIPATWSPKLETLPADPWSRPYTYEFHGDRDDESGRELDLYSLGPDGIPSDDDIEAIIDL